LLSLFLIVCLGGHAKKAIAACTPIPASAQLWSQPSIHWVWVGEMHGSTETPAAFVDLVCDALVHGKQVTVALERPTTEQSALEGMLNSSDFAMAKKTLLGQPDWKDTWDGRTSEAMFGLLVSLRELHKQYPSLRISAIDSDSYTGAVGTRDEALGKSVSALNSGQPNGLVLVLTGNMHGTKQPLLQYKSAAMYLPANELVSLQVTDRGGTLWFEASDGCGVHHGGVADKDQKRPYGVYLDPTLARFGQFDGVLALGMPLSSSPPAAGEVSPLPECRKTFLEHHQPSQTNP
jgi:hypothetical protein